VLFRSDILINPVYVGKVRWKWRADKKKFVDGKTVVETPRNYGDDCIIADGLHPPIIEKEIFEEAQTLIAQDPPPPVNAKSELKNPLAGLIICRSCGRKMTLKRGYGRLDYLVCTTRGCTNVAAPFHFVEERIMAALRLWLGDYRVTWEVVEKSDETSVVLSRKALKKLEGDIATLIKQLGTTYDLLEQGVYSTDQFLDRSRSLSERIEQAKSERASLETELGIELIREESRRSIVPKVERLLEIYDELPTPSEKNALLKDVLDKAVYAKSLRGSRRGVSPDNFEIVLCPKLPKFDTAQT
jgi:hypothetical protein